MLITRPTTAQLRLSFRQFDRKKLSSTQSTMAPKIGSTLPQPPFTPVDPVVEIIHGIEVADPYRWLEDQDSNRTRRWIEEQMRYTQSYFDAAPGRPRIAERVAELLPAGVVPEVWNVMDRVFFLKRRLDAEQPAIVMRRGCFGNDCILVDPAEKGRDAFTAAGITAVSDDGRLLAYSLRRGGTDYSSLEVLSVDNMKVLPDGLPNGFCNGFAFAPDGSGYYYSHRTLHSSRSLRRAVYFHHFEEESNRDQEIFSFGGSANTYVGLLLCEAADMLVFVVSTLDKCQHVSLYVSSIRNPSSARLLLEDLEGVFLPFFAQDRLFACTDINSPNRRVIEIDPRQPMREAWRDVVPETDRRIQQFAAVDGRIFVTRGERFSTYLESFGLDGKPSGEIFSARQGTIRLLNRGTASANLFFAFSSIRNPLTIYCQNLRTGELRTWQSEKINFNSEKILVEEFSVTSSDGVTIPVLVAGKKGLPRSRSRAAFLSAYGGFGNCVAPAYAAFSTFLIEQGFLFAIAAVRGGAELGEEWHLAGRREHRQNSFNDFISVAEWLVSSRRCAPGRLAIGGASNAGLLTGAVITQRPELFRAAVCVGPLLDMLRFHLFDHASNWIDEYGSPLDPIDFGYLMAYSPYHQVREGTCYPALMLISGDADTRCNPMHARKMTARLQAATASQNPVLLDYRQEWGHVPVQPLSIKIAALTNRLAFVCRELQVDFAEEGNS